MTRICGIFIGLTSLVACLGGCGYKMATFSGHDGSHVWSAMLTAAEQPVYEDWRVIENDVWNEPESGRIEILRLLMRDRVDAGNKPVRESETWRFQIHLLEFEPPTVRFIARQAAVPAHVWLEAERYFDEVRSLLNDPAPNTAKVVDGG